MTCVCVEHSFSVSVGALMTHGGEDPVRTVRGTGYSLG